MLVDAILDGDNRARWGARHEGIAARPLGLERDVIRIGRPRMRHTNVIVLRGGRNFFSNGIHLDVIEAAEDPAVESWLKDGVREIVATASHLVISALTGDTAARGVPLALAADQIVAREDVVMNPYYRAWAGCTGRSTGPTGRRAALGRR
jgi:hypothetical protein